MIVTPVSRRPHEPLLVDFVNFFLMVSSIPVVPIILSPLLQVTFLMANIYSSLNDPSENSKNHVIDQEINKYIF